MFNATTLERERVVATNQTHEVAAATVAPDDNGIDRLYVASFRDSSRLFRYNLQTLEYIDSMPLSPVPEVGIQGLAYRKDKDMFFLAVGRIRNLGRIYAAPRATGSTRLVYTSTLPGLARGHRLAQQPASVADRPQLLRQPRALLPTPRLLASFARPAGGRSLTAGYTLLRVLRPRRGGRVVDCDSLENY